MVGAANTRSVETVGMSYRDQNRAAWDELAKRQSPFAKVATDEECRDPLGTLDSRGWLPQSVHGLDVLCLAAAGGWQSILYACAGARVTVVDISPAMLRLDEREAARRNLSVRMIEGSMDDLSMLADETFDIVHQPVSTCYVPDIAAVYRELARVLRDGGLYVSQHKQPSSLQVVDHSGPDGYVVGVEYYLQGPIPPSRDTSYREPGAREYLHRLDQIIGELCRCGFVVEDLREPYRADPKAAPGHFGHRGRFIPPYLRMKARRIVRPTGDEATNEPSIWMPD